MKSEADALASISRLAVTSAAPAMNFFFARRLSCRSCVAASSRKGLVADRKDATCSGGEPEGIAGNVR